MVQNHQFLYDFLNLAQMFIIIYKEFHFQCSQFNYTKYPLIFSSLLINLILNSYQT